MENLRISQKQIEKLKKLQEINSPDKINIGLRVNNNIEQQLLEIHDRLGTSSNISINLFCSIRKNTLAELNGKFTLPETVALAHALKFAKPDWATFNKDYLIRQVDIAEKFNGTITKHEANYGSVVVKLQELTEPQAAILALQIWSYWNLRYRYSIETLFNS